MATLCSDTIRQSLWHGRTDVQCTPFFTHQEADSPAPPKTLSSLSDVRKLIIFTANSANFSNILIPNRGVLFRIRLSQKDPEQ